MKTMLRLFVWSGFSITFVENGNTDEMVAL